MRHPKTQAQGRGHVVYGSSGAGIGVRAGFLAVRGGGWPIGVPAHVGSLYSVYFLSSGFIAALVVLAPGACGCGSGTVWSGVVFWFPPGSAWGALQQPNGVRSVVSGVLVGVVLPPVGLRAFSGQESSACLRDVYAGDTDCQPEIDSVSLYHSKRWVNTAEC